MVGVVAEENSVRDVVTQEPASLEVVGDVAEENSRRDAVTQEPAPPEITSEVQNVQCGTLGDKVWTKPVENFIDLDSDKEYPEEEETLKPTEEISILRMEVRKWRS